MINTDGARRNPPIASPMRFLTLYLPLIEYTALAMHCEDAQMRISRISRSLERHAIESGGRLQEAPVMPHVNEHFDPRDSISTQSRLNPAVWARGLDKYSEYPKCMRPSSLVFFFGSHLSTPWCSSSTRLASSSFHARAASSLCLSWKGLGSSPSMVANVWFTSLLSKRKKTECR